MNRFIVTTFIFVFIMLACGCASQQVILDQAVIRNNTNGIISQVRVSHEPTGKIGEVHSILPNSSFNLGFSHQTMRAEKAVVTWTSNVGRESRVELIIPRDNAKAKQGTAMKLIYTIHRDGIATVEFKE